MTSMSDEDKAFIRAEIAAARKMVQEDRLMAKLNKHFPDEPEAPEGTPKPPKRKDNPNEPPPPKKSAWWGDALDS